jgi:hypothetical protein
MRSLKTSLGRPRGTESLSPGNLILTGVEGLCAAVGAAPPRRAPFAEWSAELDELEDRGPGALGGRVRVGARPVGVAGDTFPPEEDRPEPDAGRFPGCSAIGLLRSSLRTLMRRSTWRVSLFSGTPGCYAGRFLPPRRDSLPPSEAPTMPHHTGNSNALSSPTTSSTPLSASSTTSKFTAPHLPHSPLTTTASAIPKT